MIYHVGFTGTREGMTEAQKQLLKIFFLECRVHNPSIRFHHGCCVGADVEAHMIALDLDIPIHLHPPTDTKYLAPCPYNSFESPPKPYITRNHDIVNSANVLVAAPKTPYEVLRSGTWATIRYAKKIKVRTTIFSPSGSCKEVDM